MSIDNNIMIIQDILARSSQRFQIDFDEFSNCLSIFVLILIYRRAAFLNVIYVRE